jgi:hypothetical protein
VHELERYVCALRKELVDQVEAESSQDMYPNMALTVKLNEKCLTRRLSVSCVKKNMAA